MSEENQETKNQEKSDSSSKKDFKQSEQTTKAADTKDSDKKNVSEIKTNEKVDDKDIKKSSNDKPKTEKSGISSAQVDKPESKNKGKLSVKAKSNDSKDKNIKRKDSENNEQNDSQNKNAEQNELIEKLVSINRVAKVVKGGRRFSFAALVVVGDGNGMVGHGKGKAKEVPEAIKKATDEAKIKMIRVPLRQGRTLHHDIRGRYDAGKVYLRSAPSGTGVIAGGPMRAVFEALGIQDIVAKSVGTSNPHNMIRATFEALKSASSPKIIAMRRGLKINDITKEEKLDNKD